MALVTLDEIQAAINAGRPGTFDAAASAFDSVHTTLTTLVTDIPAAVNAVVGTSWSGPAATRFGTVSDDVVAFINDTATPLAPYSAALTAAGAALSTAQEQIQVYAQRMQAYRESVTALGGTPDENMINAGAQAILNTLATAYRTAVGQLGAIPETPRDIVTTTGGGDSPTGSTGPFDGSAGTPDSGNVGPALSGTEELSSSVPPDLSTLDSASLVGGGVPAFGLTVGATSSATRLTGPPSPSIGSPAPSFGLLAPGNVALAPSTTPVFTSTATSPTPAVASFGSALPVSANGFAERIPGLGAAGYAQLPEAEVTVRNGPVPPLWSQYSGGARGALAGGPAGGRRTDRKRKVKKETVVVRTALLPMEAPTEAVASRRDRRAERTTGLLGDDDWTDATTADALGRPAPRPSDRD